MFLCLMMNGLNYPPSPTKKKISFQGSPVSTEDELRAAAMSMSARLGNMPLPGVPGVGGVPGVPGATPHLLPGALPGYFPALQGEMLNSEQADGRATILMYGGIHTLSFCLIFSSLGISLKKKKTDIRHCMYENR